MMRAIANTSTKKNVEYFKAFTDAGVKNGKSVHSYCIFDSSNKLIFGEVFSSEIQESTKAEAHSIRKLLTFLKEKKIKQVKIFSDCQGVDVHLREEINSTYREVKANIYWIPRRFNRLAHNACESEDSSFFTNTSEQTEIEIKLIPFYAPEKTLLNHINHKSVSPKEKIKMYDLYVEITGDTTDVKIDDIIDWAKGRETSSTKEGRNYLVREFIEYKHLTTEKDRVITDVLLDKVELIDEFNKTTLSQNAFKQYTTLTKRNKNLSFKQAKRKLFRNMKVSYSTVINKRKNQIIYHYGNLKIFTRGNVITSISNGKNISNKWSVNRDTYDRVNAILNIDY